MPESDLLQQQAKLLKTFCQASVQRAKAEAEADARLKSETERVDRAFSDARNEANLQREEAESQVKSHLEKERRTAASTQAQSKQGANSQLDEMQKVVRSARSKLAGVGLSHLLDQTTPRVSSSTEPALISISSNADPAQGLSRSISTAENFVRAMQVSVDELCRLRDERRFQLQVLGGLAVILVVLVLAYLATSEIVVLLILAVVWTALVILLHAWGVIDTYSQKMRVVAEYPWVQKLQSLATTNGYVNEMQRYVKESRQDERKFQFQVLGGLAAILAISTLIFAVTQMAGMLVILAIAWAPFVILLREWNTLNILVEELGKVDYSLLVGNAWSKAKHYFGIIARRLGDLSRSLLQQIQSWIARLKQSMAKSDDSE